METSYLRFITHYPHISPLGVLSFFLLSLMRIGPIVQFAPFFGAKVIPRNGRAALAIALSLALLPLILVNTSRPMPFTLPFIGFCFKELFIGLFIGFIISIPFFIAESVGIIIDFMRGSSQLMSQDPTTQVQASPIGILYHYILIAMFYQFGGFEIFFNILCRSYALIPADTFFSPQFFSPHNPLWKTMLTIIHEIFSMSIQIASPSMLAILMAEAFLGIANRLAPQVQIAFLGMSLKSLLGLFLLWAAWFFILKQLSHYALNWIIHLEKFLFFFSPLPSP